MLLYNFPSSWGKDRHLKEKQLMSFAYEYVYDISVSFWHITGTGDICFPSLI